METAAETIRSEVRERYAKAAREASRVSGCCDVGYTREELSRIPEGAFLALGSGNPVRLAAPGPGETVVDLGSGAGVDVFLAADLVGPAGRAIGVDTTPEMVAKARALAAAHGVANAEFREGIIERLPVAAGAADVVVSNCVINLSPDKAAVFREAFRVLKPGGRLVVSDIVKERPFEAPWDACGCIGGAMVRGEYLETIREAGFRDVQIMDERPWPTGVPGWLASSITIRAFKREEVKA